MADFQPTIGIVTAMEKEALPFRLMLGEVPCRQVDDSFFDCGTLGGHQVALGWPNRTGTNATALLVKALLSEFPSIRTLFMVGIAGGVRHPTKQEVYLGDVVVGSPKSSVLEWDFTRYKGGELERSGHAYAPPDALFSAAVQRVYSNFRLHRKEWSDFQKHIAEVGEALAEYRRPDPATDVVHETVDGAEVVVQRKDPPDIPQVLLGTIASGNGVVKDAELRDKLRDMYLPDQRLLALEMESAGAADAAHGKARCMFVRGVCDYADAHKNKQWQEYAAATAAAFVRVLLEFVSGASPVVPVLPAREDRCQLHSPKVKTLGDVSLVTRHELGTRLGDDWHALAAHFGIEAHQVAAAAGGSQVHFVELALALVRLLAKRAVEMDTLREKLEAIHRNDLAHFLET
eukprot:CAMPEP_0174244408 /NCGR_PEP_ID=MMETSP0417-20130205/35189_1 /TAXON_ID=242541 /ORGANISM="Mayorella sp, Strain BSH-02190019" /LENGTH=401 /DNA_ID=CAMNT_0015324091 /DNA_START=77 /DNA_END=1282 /DNA_ORIENTATION=+